MNGKKTATTATTATESTIAVIIRRLGFRRQKRPNLSNQKPKNMEKPLPNPTFLFTFATANLISDNHAANLRFAVAVE